MEDSLEYWNKIKEDRLIDIEAEILIGTPDNLHMKLLKSSLKEAEDKIKELNGI
ncbi:hypothetical protein N8445_00335 [bacterium]|nr:hypothetical protein [bacterium]